MGLSALSAGVLIFQAVLRFALCNQWKSLLMSPVGKGETGLDKPFLTTTSYGSVLDPCLGHDVKDTQYTIQKCRH